LKLKRYFQKIKNKPALIPVFAILLNKYTLIVFLFIIWMLFLDTNSWLIQKDLDKEINKLEDNKKYYIKEIVKDQKDIKVLKDTGEMEKFAREKHFMKRENEEIFIIEYEDSIPKTNTDEQ